MRNLLPAANEVSGRLTINSRCADALENLTKSCGRRGALSKGVKASAFRLPLRGHASPFLSHLALRRVAPPMDTAHLNAAQLNEIIRLLEKKDALLTQMAALDEALEEIFGGTKGGRKSKAKAPKPASKRRVQPRSAGRTWK